MPWRFYKADGSLLTSIGTTADTATVATTVTVTDNESTNENNVLTFVAGADADGGNVGLESDGNLHYNPSTGALTATTFLGALTGNVTGNTSGSAGSATGNAATATALETARTIGGVSFDGTANIAVTLAATATALASARNIGGVSFDGTGNIDLPGVNSAGNQNTSGTAAGLSATLAVASGGTGATSLTDKAVLISQDSGTDTVGAVDLTTSGELVIGGSSGPVGATITAGSNITITNGDGTISIAASGGGVPNAFFFA